MGTTEYVLDVLRRCSCGQGDCPTRRWLVHDCDEVRIRRVEPECGTAWQGEARELARQFIELQAEAAPEPQAERLESQHSCPACDHVWSDAVWQVEDDEVLQCPHCGQIL